MQAQPFQLLALLVERAGEVVTRDEICRALWQRDTFVNFDHGVAVALNKIREALGDDAEKPRFIKTLPKQGYRFIAPVQELGPRLFRKAVSAPRGGRTPVENQPLAAGPIALPSDDGEEGWAEQKKKGLAATNLRASQNLRRWLPWLFGAAAALAVGAATYAFRTRPSPPPHPRESIVIADFDNPTGDPVFDGTLRQGLAVQLAQSPFLNIVPDQRVAQMLHLIGQPAGARLTDALAKQVCQRTGASAVLDGSIAQIGTQYNLILNAENCSTGESLASAQEIASDKNHVLEALSTIATSIRGKLGESLVSIRKFNKPLADVTTPSLEALKAYTLGWQDMRKADFSAAVAPFQRAISLDPDFAMAHARLATTYDTLGENSLAAESIKKAYDLRDRVSEREKFYVSSSYTWQVTGDLLKARQIFEVWAQTYPQDLTPPVNLSSNLLLLGQCDKALATARRAVTLGRDSPLSVSNLVQSYLCLDRLDEAGAILQRAKAHGIDLHLYAYWLAFLQGDKAGMAREMSWGAGRLVFQATFADTEAYNGRMAQAEDLTTRAVAANREAGHTEGAASLLAWDAVREALVGKDSEARKKAAAALQIGDGESTQIRVAESKAALAFALAGNATQAQNLADELAKRFPQDTAIRFIFLPTTRAAIALDRKAPANAIADLQTASPFELGYQAFLIPVYLRGLAYLANHQGSKAAGEFQKILDHPGVTVNILIVPLAHLGLARARALSGDKSGARKQYKDFLAMWQHADAGVPALQQAKSEYAKLQ